MTVERYTTHPLVVPYQITFRNTSSFIKHTRTYIFKTFYIVSCCDNYIPFWSLKNVVVSDTPSFVIAIVVRLYRKLLVCESISETDSLMHLG